MWRPEDFGSYCPGATDSDLWDRVSHWPMAYQLGWADRPARAFPVLGFRPRASVLAFFFFKQVLQIRLRCSCLHGKHLTELSLQSLILNSQIYCLQKPETWKKNSLLNISHMIRDWLFATENQNEESKISIQTNVYEHNNIRSSSEMSPCYSGNCRGCFLVQEAEA